MKLFFDYDIIYGLIIGFGIGSIISLYIILKMTLLKNATSPPIGRRLLGKIKRYIKK